MMKPESMRSPGLLVSALALAMGGLAPGVLLPAPDDPTRGVPSELEGRVAVEIGDLRGEVPAYRFPLVASMALGPDGLLFVSDRRLGEIRAFDTEGRYTFTVDPRLAPSEAFDALSGIVFDGEGRLWVESRAGRDLFVLEGDRTIDRTRIPRGDLSPSSPRVAAEAQVVGGQVVLLGVDPERRGETPAAMALLALSPTGEAHPLRPVPGVSREDIPAMVIRNENMIPMGSVRTAIPFSGRTLSAVGPDGTIAQLRTDRYEILRTAPDGSALPAIAGPPVDPIPVTEAERERFITNAQVSGTRIAGLTFPETHPPVLAMAFDAAGRLWVELARPTGSAERMAHVFGTDGALLHVARWPAEVSLLDGHVRPLLLEDRAWGLRSRPGIGFQVIRIDWDG